MTRRPSARGVRWAVVLAVVLTVAGCRDRQPAGPPSFLLVVLDTTRADAVSSYGRVEGTTPTVDGLAARGLLFERAWANAGWTLPSHASLFTGLDPSRHGVGWRRTWADASLVMIAERLRAAGWQTAAVSENPWVTSDFNLVQGFDHAVHVSDARQGVRDWLGAQAGERPFFLFVNVLDAHAPYTVRETNPFVPGGASPDEAHDVSRDFGDYFCRTDGAGRDIELLRGLYLGDVAAADRKLGDVLDALDQAGARENLITIVTADHGEAFGEQEMMDHIVGVGEALLRVPLVVHGLPGVRPARIGTPVTLTDVAPSLLAWAGLEPQPAMTGQPLPARDQAPDPDRAILAHWTDPGDAGGASLDHGETGIPAFARARLARLRAACPPGHTAYGTRDAVIRPPWKLVVGRDGSRRLLRLGERAGSGSAHATRQPDVAERLTAELRAAMGKPPEPEEREPTVGDAVRRRLDALGYIDAD